MIYPLYDFKKKDNSENSQVITLSEQARELLHNLNKTLYSLSSQYGEIIKSGEISDSLKKIADLHKYANSNLDNPSLVISTLGTTSSGKSTFINSLLGLKLSPMNADELSIGVLRFEHNDNYKDNCKLTIDTLIANSLWENGHFDKSYKDAYSQIKTIMENYRTQTDKDDLSPPYMTVETSFFIGNNPKFVGTDKHTKINILELPLMIADSESMQFIEEKVKASLVVFLIDYTVLFNKETEETNHLFDKLKQMKDKVGSKDAILFVLNKVDLRNYDDDELDKALEKCKNEIIEKLEIKDNFDVIPLNALLMYYIQCAFLGYENGNLKEYNPDSEIEYTESQKMYIEVIHDNLKKCLRDQAKTISEIQDASEENVDMVYEIRRIVQKGKIPSFSVFEKLWKEAMAKSGGFKFFDAVQDKTKHYLKDLILYIPMHSIISETDNFLKLISGQITIDKEKDKKHIDDERQYIMKLYNEIKEEREKIRASLKTLIDDSFIKLRRSDVRFRRDAIRDLDVGQIDETIDNIKKAIDKETIQPVEEAFIEEMRPDTLLKNLVEIHSWNEKVAKQSVEHFDFLRMKLFNEKRFIDDGRRFEISEGDEYEREKIKEINKQFDDLCHTLVSAVDERLKFELQNHIDEMAVRVSRWLIKKNKEAFEMFEKMLTKLHEKHNLKYIEPSLIKSFNHDHSFHAKIDIKPSVIETREQIEVDRTGEPVYITTWKTLWMVKVRDMISKDIDVTKFESVRTQTANWESKLINLDNDLWEIICDSLYSFFDQALLAYDEINYELMQQVNQIFKHENDKLINQSNKDDIKWKNIDNIFQEGKSLLKMMYNLSGIPDGEPALKQKSALELELSQQPGYKEIEETIVPVAIIQETVITDNTVVQETEIINSEIIQNDILQTENLESVQVEKQDSNVGAIIYEDQQNQ